MSKTFAYVVAAVVCIGIGALVAGLCVYYAHPDLVTSQQSSESRYARCVLQDTPVGGAVTGTLTLEQLRPTSPVLINGVIYGLTEGLHGFHVHEWGVDGSENNCTDAGGHYNPMGNKHSAPNATERHVGDLGNVRSVQLDAFGRTATNTSIVDNVLSLWGQYSIVGRAIVVHAGEDDLGLGKNDGSLKTGNAGGRVACCTIYLTSKPAN
uniref:Superoxide dismutase [Cu-Zn] n=1 Tax=Eriocheir sinensis TaxID=95602 RepID=G4XHW2_ERISI|nr:copper/zinc superoxide dismutase [Eriocheir sinensis]